MCSYFSNTQPGWVMDQASGASIPGPRAAKGPPSLIRCMVPRLPKEAQADH